MGLRPFTALALAIAVMCSGCATAITSAPYTISPDSAGVLGKVVSDSGGDVEYWVQYGLTTAYGNATPVQNLGSGNVAVAIGGGAIAGLACGTTYHFRATATNAGGTTNGADATFTTTVCPGPTVVTGAASAITLTSATLNGTVNPNGSATTAFSSATCSTTTSASAWIKTSPTKTGKP